MLYPNWRIRSMHCLNHQYILQKAMEAIKQAIKMDPGDDTNKKELKQVEETINKERVVHRHLDS